jgi:type I restriction enzyme S subunit
LALEKPSAIYAANILIEDRIDADAYNYLYIKEISKLKFSGLKLANITDFYSVEMLTGFENSKYINYTNQGIPFIRCKNIRDNYFDEDDLTYISEEVYNILKRAQLSDDDLLYTKTGSNLGQVCCVPKGMKAIASSNCCFFKKSQNKSIDSHYVSTFLNSKYGKVQTNRAQTKTGQPTIDFQRLKQFLIPIPSPEIQKYIGDKVRKAEELREEAKRLKKEAETFLYEMIQLKPLNDFDKDMFSFVNSNYIDSERLDSEYYKTKYITLEKLLKSKKVTSFKDIIIESKYGASVPADYTMVGIPFIRGNNLTDNEINIDDIVYLNKKLKDEVKDHHVNTGDILITRSGTVGISAVVDEKCDGFSFGSFMIKLRIDMRIWNPYYIAAFLNSFWGKWQIERLQNGAVQQNINLQEIGRIIIPIISKENQDKIEELIKNYINKKRQSKQLIQEAKQDVEDLIEGNFDMSKVKANS